MTLGRKIALGIVLATVPVAAIGTCAGAREPGPFVGDRSATVEIDSVTATGVADALVLEKRLEALGVDGLVVVSDSRRIALTLRQVSDPSAVLNAVLAPGHFALRTGMPGWEGGVDPATVAPDAPGVRANECRNLGPGGPPHCILHLLQDPPVVSEVNIADAELAWGERDNMPFVMVRLDAAGTERLAAASAAHLGESVALLVDGEVFQVVRIAGHLDRGELRLEAYTDDDPLLRARVIAAELGSGPLAGEWSVATLQPQSP